MKASDLKPFCCDYRSEMMEPFSNGEFTYATDGKILIRVPCLDDVETSTALPLSRIEGAASIAGRPPFFIEDIVDWVPAPDLAGRSFKKVCEECFERPLSEIKDDCSECGGTGVCMGWASNVDFIHIGKRIFNPYFIHKLSVFPGLEFAPSIGRPTEAIIFRFDGGQGLVMPLKHIDPVTQFVSSPEEPATAPTEE